MKTKLLLVAIFLFAGMAWGQESFKVKDTITLSNTIVIDKSRNNPFEYSDTLSTLSANSLKGGFRYKIIKQDSNKVKLQALNFKIYNIKRIERRNKRKGFLDNRTLDKSISSILYNDKIFEVDKEDFDSSATHKHNQLPDRLTIGILTLPFKFRPQKSKSFDSDFNLNSTLACRFLSLGGGHLYGQIGAGIGGVELNEVNSKGITDEATIKANTLSMLTGLMIQYKKVQAGIYLGTDFINNQPYYQWQYQGKSWFAFGIGYQIFNIGLGGAKKLNE